MHINQVDIQNYRNLDGCSVKFSGLATYVVGENGLGKTNLLRLLYSVFNRTMLSEEDFKDPNVELSIQIELMLEDYEVGLFSDIADSANYLQITIKGVVEDPESEFQFFHVESGEELSGAQVRRICFFLFESMNADNRSLDYNKGRGVGRVLTQSLVNYLEGNNLKTLDFIDSSKLKSLIDYLNDVLGKVAILSGYGIHAGVGASDSDALGDIVTLVDSNGLHFRHASSGVQYAALAVLQIIDAVLRVPEKKLEKCIFQDEKGNKILSTILAFDEPEIHLHPYMQRSLTKCLNAIASGKDDGFNALLKEYFDIDSIRAQLIVVTHSPSIVPQDYKRIVRFYNDGHSSASIKMGCDLSLEPDEETRLIALFDSVKEAFFSRKVIVVEGESEVMSFPGFANSLGFDLDAMGVTLVNAHGKPSVSGVYKLLQKFGIPSWSIVDRDTDAEVASGNERTTAERDFEFEIINALFAHSKQDLFIEILKMCEWEGRRKELPASQLNTCANKYFPGKFNNYQFCNADFLGSRFDGVFRDDSFTRLMMYSWMSKQKGVLFGKLIGEVLPSICIPSCYSRLLEDVTR